MPARSTSRSSTAASSKIDGGDDNPVTRNFICAKVRRFGERVYGEDRLLYPAVRKGAKGAGTFERVTWDEALDLIATRMREIKATRGGEAILPYLLRRLERPADAEHQRRRAVAPVRHVAPGDDHLRGADRRGQPRALRQDGRRSSTRTTRTRKLIILWGVNPSASGIHLIPYVKEAQAAGAHAGRHRSAHDLARQEGRPASGARARAPTCRSRWRCTASCSRKDTPTRRSSTRTRHGADRLRAARRRRGRSSARPPRPAIDAGRRCGGSPISTSHASPALVRCGWGLERNRNGGNAAAAVLALPAVGGKFGVRGGGYSMSNSLAFGLKSAPWIDTPEPRDPPRQHESSRPGADRVHDAAGQHAVRLQLQSAGDGAGSEPRAARDCSATTSSPSSSSRSSPTPRATPTSSCRRRRSSSTTTSPRPTARSRCSWSGR